MVTTQLLENFKPQGRCKTGADEVPPGLFVGKYDEPPRHRDHEAARVVEQVFVGDAQQFRGKKKIANDDGFGQKDANCQSKPMKVHLVQSRRGQRSAGFTLMELVFVIVIMGVVSAVAIPRFVNLQQESRSAKVDGIYAAVASATQIVRSVAAVRGGATSVVLRTGTTVNLVNGYPAATTAGIIAATSLASDTSLTYSSNTGSITINVSASNVSSVVAGSCGVTYAEASPTGPPTITRTATGC